ncbi:UDP-glucose 4-epimerase [Armadillidium nasatum]|uniref:UDP-glucose 4-epimerase n=1 Tax=Armadillidium nasatum TaxID=96803 RepID=A0A5N5SXS7_9CRUS|nr:UDP-glucose 4-epimerase [Armadillidium nasatum]
MDPGKTVFVTGGTGYIGSHCILELLNSGYDVITVDNLLNSRSGSLKRVENLTGKKITFYHCDLTDLKMVHKIFAKAMKTNGVFQMVFSSSCSVYGDAKTFPIKESHPTGNVTCPYGRSKYFIEEILKDLTNAEPKWNIISLRYFNPIGAHKSGKIGEDNTKKFTNLVPLISQVAIGKRSHLKIFGGDYDTKDGTAVRDYIHVVDLVKGHVIALEKIQEHHIKFKAYNLGLGQGLTVLELVEAFEKASGKKVAYKIEERRPGDVARLVCDASLAKEELRWVPKLTVKDMCEDYWQWQTLNPNGYEDDEPYQANTL